jgi:hypothetical protein
MRTGTQELHARRFNKVAKSQEWPGRFATHESDRREERRWYLDPAL